MFCRHVLGNISGRFRGISRFGGNFAGFRGNTWISQVRNRAKYQKPCLLIGIVLSSAAIWNLSNSLAGCSTIKLTVGQTFMSNDTLALLIINVLLFSCCFTTTCGQPKPLSLLQPIIYFDWLLNFLKCVFSHSNADDLVKVLLKNFIIKEKTPQQLIRVTNGGWFCKYFL